MEGEIRLLIELVEKSMPYLLGAARQRVTANIVVFSLLTLICLAWYAAIPRVLRRIVDVGHSYDQEMWNTLVVIATISASVVFIAVVVTLLQYVIAPDYATLKVMMNLLD